MSRTLHHPRRWSAPVIGLALMLVVSACGGSADSGSGNAASGGGESGGTTEVTTFVCCSSGTEIPTWLTEDEGLFEAHGVTVGELQVLPPPTDVQALLSGSVDIGVVAPSSLLNAYANGNDDLVFVSGKVNSPVYRVMSQTITDASQLKGKRLGVSGQYAPPAVAAYAYLEDEFGLKPFEDYEVVPFPKINDLVPALGQGTIDAAVVSTPLHLVAEQQGAKEVVNLSGELVQANAWIGTTRTFAEENPEAVKNYVAALAEGVSMTKADKEAALAAIAKHQPDITPENAEATYADYAEVFDVSMPVEGLALYQRYTDLEALADVDPADVIDDSFLRQLEEDGTLAELGLSLDGA
jgi:ABC-type nitrate/sulfonate/bicarbonate transport system substrate-binding protein